ncbi:MAG: major facilitator superfamily 1 [Bryobacterales bacterium]|nr:major facilitator superfamily 1 [Bryobacterales bacterium]
MDVLLYVFALNTLRTEFHLSNSEAGLVSSITLICSALGGIAAGILADRFGRTRLLAATILFYSLASGGTALSSGLGGLIFWRGLVGFGLGGEWSAGAVLVAETWPAKHRAKAISFMQAGWALGYLLAAGVTAVVLPRFGWRALFLTGLLPALLALAVQRGVAEPKVWLERTRIAGGPGFGSIFRPPLRRRTVLATLLTTSVLFAYWGLFTWLPGFLSAPRAAGGAGLSILRTSAALVPMQIGAFVGYVSFGWIADRFGRRATFVAYMLMAAILTPIYGFARSESTLVLLGPLIGFFGSGYFSLFGAMLAEIYPSSIRGAAQGFTYNFGRGLSALAPFLVGALADRNGIGAALAVNSAFFLTGAILIFTIPKIDEIGAESVLPPAPHVRIQS